MKQTIHKDHNVKNSLSQKKKSTVSLHGILVSWLKTWWTQVIHSIDPFLYGFNANNLWREIIRVFTVNWNYPKWHQNHTTLTLQTARDSTKQYFSQSWIMSMYSTCSIQYISWLCRQISVCNYLPLLAWLCNNYRCASIRILVCVIFYMCIFSNDGNTYKFHWCNAQLF